MEETDTQLRAEFKRSDLPAESLAWRGGRRVLVPSQTVCLSAGDGAVQCRRTIGHGGSLHAAPGPHGRILRWTLTRAQRLLQDMASQSRHDQCGDVYFMGMVCLRPIGHNAKHAAPDGQEQVFEWDQSPEWQAVYDHLVAIAGVEYGRNAIIITRTAGELGFWIRAREPFIDIELAFADTSHVVCTHVDLEHRPRLG